MKDPKYHIYLTNEERSEVLKSLIDLKNEMIVQGKYTDVLDEIIVKLYAECSNLLKFGPMMRIRALDFSDMS